MKKQINNVQIVGVNFLDKTGKVQDTKTYYYKDLCNCKVGDRALVEVCRVSSDIEKCEVEIVTIVKEIGLNVYKYILCKIESEYTRLRNELERVNVALDHNLYNLQDFLSGIAYERLASALLGESQLLSDELNQLKASKQALDSCHKLREQLLAKLGETE